MALKARALPASDSANAMSKPHPSHPAQPGETVNVWTMCDTNYTGRCEEERQVAQYIARWISEGSADPNETAKQKSLLRQACIEGSVFIAGALLDGGANPNAKDSDGETPLHLVDALKNLPLVAKLIVAGADPTVRSNAGKTALKAAEDWGPPEEVLHLLRTAAAHRLARDALNDIQTTDLASLDKGRSP